MILAGIVSAIFFGLTENIIYSITQYLSSSFIQTANLLADRSLLPIIVHIGAVCSGCCLLLYGQKHNSRSLLIGSLGAMISIGSHLLYNMSHSLALGGIIKVILIIGYCCCIHYCLFKSDTLYTNTQTT